MKKLNTYINETLKLSRSEYINEWQLSSKTTLNVNGNYTHFPNSTAQLVNIIADKIIENEKDPYLLDINTTNIKEMLYLFDSVNKTLNERLRETYEFKIENLDLSTWNTQNVISIMNAFQHLKQLKIIKFSPKFKLHVRDMRSLFFGCESLEYIDVSSFDVNQMTNYINYMFYGCKKLKRIDGLEKWDVYGVDYANDMFENCESLESIKIENWNINFNKDLHFFDMFKGCKRSIIPDWYNKIK